MALQIISKRKFQINELNEMIPLFAELHSLAKKQPGYISRETLRSLDHHGEFFVVSRWDTADDWKRWMHKTERRETQGKLDSLIGEKTFYEMFESLSL